MRRALSYSAALHVAVFAVAWFGVPVLFRTPPVEDQPVAVELVSLQEVPKKAPPKPEPKPAPPPVAKPAPPPPPPPPVAEPEPPPPPKVVEPAPQPEPPPPPKVEPKAEPKPVAKVEPKPAPKPKPKPKPVAKAEPKLKPKPVAKAEPKPKPVEKAEPKPKPPEPDQMQALLKNLAKRKAELERSQKPDPAPAPRQEQVASARSAVDRQITERRLTQRVKEQLAPCWNIPAGAKDIQNMSVQVQIRLNADGSLQGAPRVLDASRMSSDRAFRAVAESAVRALLNPRCSPLRLPYEEYDVWKNITFNFDPSEALGP